MATMSTDDQYRLIGQILADEAFRNALLADPAGTLAANGYPVDQNVIAAITATSKETLEHVVKAFHKGDKSSGAAQ